MSDVTATTEQDRLEDAITRWWTDADARQTPHDLFDRARVEDPIHYSETAKSWFLTRHADINAVLRSRHALRAPTAGRHVQDWLYDENGELRPSHRLASGSFRYKEGEPHQRLRSLAAKALNSPNIVRWQDDIDRETERAIASVREAKQMDLVDEFAHLLPLRQILRILGIATDDAESYRRWTAAILPAQAITATPEEIARGDVAAVEFEASLAELIAARRAQPASEDLLSALVYAEDGHERLTDAELVSITFGFISAGHETTASLIGTMTHALLCHPDQLALLRDDLTLVPAAIEEGLRYDGPAQWVPRFALEGLEVDGTEIPQGDHIALMLLSANHDPDVFLDPHRLVIGRDTRASLAFAAGVHFCPGSWLARAEGVSALRAIVTSLPGLELVSEPSYRQASQGRSLQSLQVTWR